MRKIVDETLPHTKDAQSRTYLPTEMGRAESFAKPNSETNSPKLSCNQMSHLEKNEECKKSFVRNYYISVFLFNKNDTYVCTSWAKLKYMALV